MPLTTGPRSLLVYHSSFGEPLGHWMSNFVCRLEVLDDFDGTMHEPIHCCGWCVFLNPAVYPSLKAFLKACRSAAREGFWSCSAGPSCLKYFWAIVFTSASVGNVAPGGAFSPAFSPL